MTVVEIITLSIGLLVLTYGMALLLFNAYFSAKESFITRLKRKIMEEE